MGRYSQRHRSRVALLVTAQGNPIAHAYSWQGQAVVDEAFVRLTPEQARQWFNVCGTPVPAGMEGAPEAAASAKTAGMELPQATKPAQRLELRPRTVAAGSTMSGESTAVFAAAAPAVSDRAASATPAETAGTPPRQQAGPVGVELLSVSTTLPAGLVTVDSSPEETP
jgi:hypothetical protein